MELSPETTYKEKYEDLLEVNKQLEHRIVCANIISNHRLEIMNKLRDSLHYTLELNKNMNKNNITKNTLINYKIDLS